MSDLTLTREEIEGLTGYKRPAEQLRELHRLGFFRARRGRVSGEVILERAHVESVAAGHVATVPGEPARNHPRLRAVT